VHPTPSRLRARWLAGQLAAGVCAALALSGCSQGDSAAAAKTLPAARAAPVVVATVARRTLPVQISGFGNVEAYATVAVKSLVDGQIVRVGFQDGQDVKRGQLLFQIDPRPFQARLNEALANLARDRAQLENARAQAQRFHDLLGKNYVSQAQYTQARTALDAARAVIKADQAAIETVRLQLDYSTIRSPISGRTGKVMIQEGNLVKANDTNPLVMINQTSPVYVEFSVPEQELTAVREAMQAGPVSVSARLPHTEVPPSSGQLTFVDNTVDTSTGTIELRATFANTDHALWPGQFVTVSLTLREEKDVVVVPSQALQTGPHGQFVFVVKPDQTVEVREVKVERTRGADAVIAAGLAPGEVVVTEGQLRLNAGVKVRPAKGASAS
jgi:multidrug efflux system membrane fusion protein